MGSSVYLPQILDEQLLFSGATLALHRIESHRTGSNRPLEDASALQAENSVPRATTWVYIYHQAYYIVQYNFKACMRKCNLATSTAINLRHFTLFQSLLYFFFTLFIFWVSYSKAKTLRENGACVGYRGSTQVSRVAQWSGSLPWHALSA